MSLVLDIADKREVGLHYTLKRLADALDTIIAAERSGAERGPRKRQRPHALLPLNEQLKRDGI